MTAVERVMEYTKLPQEDEASKPGNVPSKSWPQEGVIQFSDVYLRYDKDEKDVLKAKRIKWKGLLIHAHCMQDHYFALINLNQKLQYLPPASFSLPIILLDSRGSISSPRAMRRLELWVGRGRVSQAC